MAFWVHREVKSTDRKAPPTYDPPAPKAAAADGYAFLCCEIQREVLIFSSREQLAEFMAVMSKKPLPTSMQLSAKRGSSVGPNGHWLSRLPATLKGPRARERMVKALASIPSDVWSTTPKETQK